MSIFDFFKKTPVSSAGEVNPTDDSPVARLFEEEALDELARYITRIPDPDEVLRRAGIKRHQMKTMLYDDEIGQACETRRDAMLAVPGHIEIVPGEGADKSKELMELMEPHLRSIQVGAWQARLYGYSVLEAVYTRTDKGLIGFDFVGQKPMQWFEPKPDGTLRFFPSDGSGGAEGVQVNTEYKFFLTRFLATYENPFGEALLSRLYWAWYFRQNGWKFWAKFLERFGTPLLVGKSADPTKMVAALLSAHSNAVIGIGRDDSVETVGDKGLTGGATFDTFESAVVRRIQKLVLGQTLTSGTDGGSGNRALGQVHDNVRIDKRNADISMVQETAQHAVNALCKLNGWGRHLIEFADGVGLEADRATRDKSLYDVGVRFTPVYLAEKYDLNEGDFTLAGDAPVADPTATPPTPPVPPASAKKQGRAYPGFAGAGAPSSFANSGAPKFTQAQQGVEDLAGDALEDAVQPLDPALVRKAVLAATSPEDLSERLFMLIGDNVADTEFQRVLEQALFAADVLGYVAAEEQGK